MIETGRLLIRPWRDEDRAPFAAMGRDPAVMEHLGPLLDTAAATASIARQTHYQHELGHCFWAIERRTDGAFLGFCGIKPGPTDTPIESLPELGYRFARTAWGQGYAREAAAACLDWAWDSTPWRRVFAITTPANNRSWGLMLRLGLQRLPGLDFNHPNLPQDDRLSRHVTYAIRRP